MASHAAIDTQGVAVATLSAQATDPRIGTWTLNAAKSTMCPGPPPQRVTRTYENRGGGEIRWTMEVVDAKGEPSHEQVTFKLDGQDYPRAVAKDTTVSQALANADTVEGIMKMDGKVTGTYTMTVSKDRKTMTFQGADAQGRKSECVQAFDRQ
jgi:hypothetical protein